MDAVVSRGRRYGAPRTFVLLVATALALLATAATASASIPGGPVTHVFGDEFDGSGLNLSVWERGWSGDDPITGPMSHRCLSRDNVSVSSGRVHLKVTKLPTGQMVTCTDRTGSDTVGWLGGLIDSQPRSGHPGFTYKYGYVEWGVKLPHSSDAKAKIECPEGYNNGHCIADLPQLWSMDENHNYEIDTVEGMHGKACFNTHPPSSAPSTCQAPLSSFNDDGWHTFGSLWTPTGIDYYYDGTNVGHRDTVPTSQFLVMDIIEAAPQLDGATLDVESVNVWQPDADGDDVPDAPAANSTGNSDLCPDTFGPAATHGCPPPASTTAPSIQLSGSSPGVGVTATATTGGWNGSPTSYAYQWSTCADGSCTAVAGATSATYVPTMDTVGRTLRVSVTAANEWGSATRASATSAAVVPPPGLYFVGANGQLWWQWYNSAGGAWTYGQVSSLPAGVTATGRPAVTYGTNASRDIYVRGSDGQIWQVQWSQGAWTTTALGGSGTSAAAGSPTALTEADGTSLDIYYRGVDGQIWQFNHSAFGWAGPVAHSASAAGDPVAVREPGTASQDIYYTGTDQHVHQLQFSSSVWSGPFDRGGSATGRPSVVVAPDNSFQDIYYTGTDSHIHHINWSAQFGWAGPVDQGGSATGSPTAVLYAGGTAQDIFFTGSDGAMWQLQHSAFGWAGPISHGGSVTGSPGAMLAGDDQGQYVFWRTSGGGLQQLQFSQQFGWAAAALQGAAGGDPAAM